MRRKEADLEFSTDGTPPPITLPLIAISCAIAAVIGEAVFLAPVMDGFGIADTSLQLIFAGVIVITTSGLVEISKRTYSARAANRSTIHESETKAPGVSGLVFSVFITLLALTLVFILGWWRAEEMIHTASVQSGAWGEFLTNNPFLTRLIVVLLTTALPVFVAFAFDWGLSGLRLAWEWRKAQKVFIRINKNPQITPIARIKFWKIGGIRGIRVDEISEFVRPHLNDQTHYTTKKQAHVRTHPITPQVVLQVQRLGQDQDRCDPHNIGPRTH